MKKFLFGILGLIFALPAVADLAPCRNLFDPTKVLFGYYIDRTTGDKQQNAQNFMSSDDGYIPCLPNTTYTFVGKNKTNGTYSKYNTIYFFDSAKNYLGASPYNISQPTTGTTPSNCHYLQVRSNPLDTSSVTIQDAFSRFNWQLEQGSTATEYVPSCANQIKIATTAYNSARFSPVVTELNTTIATIRNVVTNTINQTKAIADLQATKQTRPNENCPAGKKCLLVEDNDGTPHWFEIVESAD